MDYTIQKQNSVTNEWYDFTVPNRDYGSAARHLLRLRADNVHGKYRLVRRLIDELVLSI